MKKLLFALALIITGHTILAQDSPIQAFMKNYDGGDATTSVFIGPSMVEMIMQSAEGNEDAEELKEMFQGFEGMRILVFEENVSQAYESFKSKVSLKDYEELMTVKEEDQTVMIVGDPNANETYREIAMIIYEGERELVLMSFIGTLRKDQLKSLNKAFNMDLDEVIE